MTVRETSVRACAKLNLSLRVLYKRPDNYHEIRTVFQTISVADHLDIRYEPARSTRIDIDGPPIADNLVERAARRCLEEMRVTACVRFGLKKRIPMGAGLGGGSSDAAAVLLALPVLAGRAIPLERLVALACGLGSDVPFFLYGGTAVGLGRGEELYPLPGGKPRPGLLVLPGIHVSTAEAYAALECQPRGTIASEEAGRLAAFQAGAWSGEGFAPENDFERAVFRLHPRLKSLKKKLLSQGAETALMTGSGSTIFGLFNRKETRDHVVQSWGEDCSLRFSLVGRASYRRQWLRRLAPHIKGNLWPPRSRYER